MGADIFIIKVNKEELQEKLKYHDVRELTGDDIKEIKEDEINSFINVFERYFEKNEISYEVGSYREITVTELDSMLRFLERRLSLACDRTDWTFRMTAMIYDKMKEWKEGLKDSSLLFWQEKA